MTGLAYVACARCDTVAAVPDVLPRSECPTCRSDCLDEVSVDDGASAYFSRGMHTEQ